MGDFTAVQAEIVRVTDEIRDLLLAKNREYGNSALEPIGVFSCASVVEQIETRIDDKLARIRATRRMAEVKIHEDTEADLIGYLVLLRVARRLAP